jgi:hypothetical protein
MLVVYKEGLGAGPSAWTVSTKWSRWPTKNGSRP